MYRNQWEPGFFGSVTSVRGWSAPVFAKGDRMKIKTVILGAAAGIGALLALAAPASAYVVCNAGGDC